MPNHESSTVKNSTSTESSPNELLAHAQAAADTSAESEEMLEQLMQLLALELLAAKKQGKPLSENLPLIDRLLKHEALRQRRAALRLRQLKAAAKSTTPSARSQKASSSATRTPNEAPPLITASTPSLEDQAYMESLLERYGYLPKDRPNSENNQFRIDPKIVALPLMDEEPVGMKKAYV